MSGEVVRIHQRVGEGHVPSPLDGQWMPIDVLGVTTEPEKEAFVRGLHKMAVGQEYVPFTIAQLLDASEILGIEYEDGVKKGLKAIEDDTIAIPARELLNLRVIRAQTLIARTALSMLSLGTVSRDG